MRSARALRNIYSGLSRDKEPESGVSFDEADPRNPALTTDLSFELWRPESVVRVERRRTNQEEERGTDPGHKTVEQVPGADDRETGEVERPGVAKRVSFGAVGSARVRAPRPGERAGSEGLAPEAKWAAIQKSLKGVQSSDSRAGGWKAEEERGLTVGSADAETRKIDGGVSFKGLVEKPSTGKGERTLNVAFGSLFYPSQSGDASEVEESGNPYDDGREAGHSTAHAEKASGDRSGSIAEGIPCKSVERAPRNGAPIRTSSYFSRKGLELDDRGQPVGVGANYRSIPEGSTGQERRDSAEGNNRSPAYDRRTETETEPEKETETDLAQSIAELAGNREWRSHENYLTPEAEIRGAQKSAKGLGDERESSQALAGRVEEKESVWVATTRGGKRSVVKGWGGVKRSMKKAVVWMGLKRKDTKVGVYLDNLDQGWSFASSACGEKVCLTVWVMVPCESLSEKMIASREDI